MVSNGRSVHEANVLKARHAIVNSAFRAASWFALFRAIAQSLSWVATVLIARLLVPSDYGLMAMSTVIIGFAVIFRELGLGVAIIQRPSTTDEELSSIFWFSATFGVLLALLCFPIASLTGYIMKEPKVVPITQSVSGIFVLGGLQIVPLSLIKKNLNFKAIGVMEMIAMFSSSIVMIVCAALGAGVWTFVLGHYTRTVINLVYTYSLTRWRPIAHFGYPNLKPFLKFGVITALSMSVSYLWQKSDRFFAGRAWASQALGYYTFALELSQIPTEKIVSLLNQVSFPTFSKLQSDSEGFSHFYLQIIKTTAFIVFPLFVGGFILGEPLVILLLGDKWRPMVSIFCFLCLSQIPVALNAVNNSAHLAQNRPTWGLFFHLLCLCVIPVAFYFSANYGIEAMVLPWLAIYTLVCLFWIFITIRKIRIEISAYLKSLWHPFWGTIFMATIVLLGQYLLTSLGDSTIAILLSCLTIGLVSYVGYFMIFDRSLLSALRMLRTNR